MITIHKYTLTDAFTTIAMPKGAEILCLQMQHSVPNMWAKVDTMQDDEMRTFQVFGTGHLLPEDPDIKYIGTFQTGDGHLVWHVFEM